MKVGQSESTIEHDIKIGNDVVTGIKLKLRGYVLTRLTADDDVRSL